MIEDIYTGPLADCERLQLILATLRESHLSTAAQLGHKPESAHSRCTAIRVEQFDDKFWDVVVEGDELTTTDTLELAAFALGVEYGATAALAEVAL